MRVHAVIFKLNKVGQVMKAIRKKMTPINEI